MIEKIYHQFAQQLLKFIVTKVGDLSSAEDILQEVFIQVIKKIDTLENETKLAPWLYQICRHKIIDYYRLKKLSTVSLESTHTDDWAHAPEFDNSSGVEQLERCISILINDLPDKLSGVVHKSELQEIKHKEIALDQAISLPAVKSRVRRGRLQLKEKLQACCNIAFVGEGVETHCQPQCGCDD